MFLLLFLYLFMFKLLLPLLLLFYMTPINIWCFVVNKLFNNNTNTNLNRVSSIFDIVINNMYKLCNTTILVITYVLYVYYVYNYIKFLITVFYDRKYYIPIKSFLTNIPRHVADKGHSGMPCVHVVSRCLPHVRFELFDSLCNLISVYIIIVMLLSYFFCFCYLILIYFCVEFLSRKHIDIKGFIFYSLFNYIILYTYAMCINY